ncbi:tyrosine-type recombinase/integrase [Glycocaulis sp.]|uniref:tyrosine-type recombinase/integrase n=1 Tax=Glycocaulis sp. TaxID=1969725 RepID=UPI003F71B542
MPRQASRKAKLTKTYIESLKPEVKRYRVLDTVQPGFCVFVAKTGRCTFAVRYVTAEGKNSDKVLGDYPSLLPDRARELAAEARTDVRAKGADPVIQARSKRKEGTERRQRTLEALVEVYLKDAEARGKKRPSTLAKERAHLNKNILPRLGNLPVDKITAMDVTEALADIKASAARRGSGDGNAAANDCRKYLMLILKFGGKRGWLAANPVVDVEKYPEKPRTRIATDAELRALWNQWEAQKAPKSSSKRLAGEGEARGKGWVSASALQFLTLTLQRGEEVASMRWSEVDFEARRWTIPAERKKENRSAIVPLSPQALAILEYAREVNKDEEGPFMGRAGEAGQDTIERDSMTQAFERACIKLGIEGLKAHDMRRTGRTRLTDGERLGFPIHVGEVVLNHKHGDSLVRNYDINAYLPEKRAALEAWAAYVERVARGEPGVVRPEGNVVALSKAKMHV